MLKIKCLEANMHEQEGYRGFVEPGARRRDLLLAIQGRS